MDQNPSSLSSEGGFSAFCFGAPLLRALLAELPTWPVPARPVAPTGEAQRECSDARGPLRATAASVWSRRTGPSFCGAGMPPTDFWANWDATDPIEVALVHLPEERPSDFWANWDATDPRWRPSLTVDRVGQEMGEDVHGGGAGAWQVCRSAGLELLDCRSVLPAEATDQACPRDVTKARWAFAPSAWAALCR